MKLVILMCVYNDWFSCQKLLPLIDVQLGRAGLAADVFVVDDGSSESCPDLFISSQLHAVGEVNILRLHKNMGSQRAIAVGLCYLYQHLKCDAVLIMDADGEDRPEDVVRLVEKLKSE